MMVKMYLAVVVCVEADFCYVTVICTVANFCNSFQNVRSYVYMKQ